MKLTEVTVHKYKCFQNDQTIKVEEDVTVLVGMNESGKTSMLEALAKTRYFQKDPKFVFDDTHDYPRREKKAMTKAGDVRAAVTCTYSFDDDLIAAIKKEFGKDSVKAQDLVVTTKYNNHNTWHTGDLVNVEKFLQYRCGQLKIKDKELVDRIMAVRSQESLNEILGSVEHEDTKAQLGELSKYFENKWGWGEDSVVSEYVSRLIIEPALPRFLYYDEYYSLPSRVSIEALERSASLDEEMKTARALFELSDINTKDIIGADDFEDFVAELEATEGLITTELFEFWSTNKNLRIQFAIDKKIDDSNAANHRIVEHVLDIRVRNDRAQMSLPLKNRSKGFNWFFSFLVWFLKIQEDKDRQYIVLLDEPGLNLHAKAQGDLLRFIEKLSGDYQVLYTTHSPFMIDSDRLDRVRTVVESKDGATISDSIQEKDPNTLFPLQAALGYDIAQNLYVSKKNLLVEGVSDLIYFQHLSSLLEAAGRTGLAEGITIVPTGGLEKVATFVSLMRGNKLRMACLLDNPADQSSQQRLDRIIREKLIHEKSVLFFSQFTSNKVPADVEDMFDVPEYLDMFNGAFGVDKGFTQLDKKSLPGGVADRIVERVAEALGKPRYNHYRPANFLAADAGATIKLSGATLDRFEAAFTAVNKLLS